MAYVKAFNLGIFTSTNIFTMVAFAKVMLMATFTFLLLPPL
jgi:hypothetical protein